ncbi:MAG TPA: NAD-dependent epimerase/dehydratase family protein [Candidatus Rubrimentiphilum sp.]|nr:NAD-dependent epimerase/dehydratase family protein [Candidatus Rubrimentiphilum sp.]
MKIVITGVAGFIGSNLADRLLTEGHDVLGIDNLAYGLREQVPPGVEFVELDIRDRTIDGALKGAGAVYHLAAKNCIPDCEDDPAETASINVEGSVNVFEAARRANVPKVIYAETSALYEGSGKFPSVESDVAPQSFYAISKFAGMAFAKRYREHFGMRMTALRYFNVYGPRQDYRRSIPPVMSAFIMKLLQGRRPIVYGSGRKRRDFIFVDDVNDFHVACLTDPRTDGGTYNLGSGRNHSVLEIYEKVAELVGVRIEPEHRPDIPGDEAQETLADITAARALGWAPKVSLEDGLLRSIAFIRDHVLAG